VKLTLLVARWWCGKVEKRKATGDRKTVGNWCIDGGDGNDWRWYCSAGVTDRCGECCDDADLLLVLLWLIGIDDDRDGWLNWRYWADGHWCARWQFGDRWHCWPGDDADGVIDAVVTGRMMTWTRHCIDEQACYCWPGITIVCCCCTFEITLFLITVMCW